MIIVNTVSTIAGVSINFTMENFVVSEEESATVCAQLIGETETEIDVELSTSSGSATRGMFRPKW